MNSGRRRPGYGVLLLAYQVFGVMGIKFIPPVTLLLVALHSSIYLRLFELPWRKSSQVCISVINVYYKKEYRRLLFAAFEHGDDWHLYYNMLSFIVKGKALEKHFGSVKFLIITLTFTALTSVTLVVLSFMASEYLDTDYEYHCAIGFSGVIFALKVLTSYYFPNYTNQIMGIPLIVPAKYAVWVELILIQLLVPNVSFLGHLAGILVGLAYVKTPLKYFVDSICSGIQGTNRSSYRQFRPQAEPSGYAHSFSPHGMDEDEQIRQATEASLQNNWLAQQPGFGTFNADNEELRRRRLARYR